MSMDIRERKSLSGYLLYRQEISRAFANWRVSQAVEEQLFESQGRAQYVGARRPDAYTAGFSTSLNPLFLLRLIVYRGDLSAQKLSFLFPDFSFLFFLFFFLSDNSQTSVSKSKTGGKLSLDIQLFAMLVRKSIHRDEKIFQRRIQRKDSRSMVRRHSEFAVSLLFGRRQQTEDRWTLITSFLLRKYHAIAREKEILQKKEKK